MVPSVESTDSRDTRDRLLDAAEAAFAEHGLAGASLRDITQRAGANLAAVNYYFDGKDGLLREVFLRRIGPLNVERLRLLDFAEQAAGKASPTLESVLHAFVAPTIRMCTTEPTFMQLCARIHSIPTPDFMKDVLANNFEEVIRRFQTALVRALPEVPVTEIFWRMHFLFGAMVHTWGNMDKLAIVSKGVCAFDNEDALIERLVAFGAAGMRAPAIAAKP